MVAFVLSQEGESGGLAWGSRYGPVQTDCTVTCAGDATSFCVSRPAGCPTVPSRRCPVHPLLARWPLTAHGTDLTSTPSSLAGYRKTGRRRILQHATEVYTEQEASVASGTRDGMRKSAGRGSAASVVRQHHSHRRLHKASEQLL